MTELRKQIADAIAEDKLCRRPGVAAGLYGLADLGPHVGWDPKCGVPAVVASLPGPHATEFDVATSDAQFVERFKSATPTLAAFDFKAHGLVVAGGAVSAIALKAAGRRHFDDFDLFLVGRTENGAKESINALARHLAARWDDLHVYRTEKCVTFHSANASRGRGREVATVQVVLRLYSTAAEVVHGFDLGSCAFLFDGASVFTTALGKLAAERGVNVLNLAARRNSYEFRISRYFQRGFGLVMPHLDIDSLKALGGVMPYLQAGWCVDGDTHGNTAVAYGLYRAGRDVTAFVSEYETHKTPYGCRHAIDSRNATAVGESQVYVASLCAMAAYTPDLDIFALAPTISEEGLARLVQRAVSAGDIKARYLTRILGPSAMLQIVAVAASLSRRGLEAALADAGSPLSRLIAAVCRRRCGEINPRAVIPFVFMRVEENTALTGPFPRSVVTVEEWYGKALFGLCHAG